MPAKMLVIGSNVLRMAARCAPIKCSLLEEHDCTDAEGEGKEDCYAPTAHCLRQAELMRDQAEGQCTDRTDERHVKAQAEARDLTVAEMPEKQDIDGIGHTGR